MISAGHKHKFRPVQPKDDGCIAGIRRCDCGKTFRQIKRRPWDAKPDQCTWAIPCRDHPIKKEKYRRA
jgi:hypothetical protein